MEFATLDWVHWINTQRLLEPLDHLPLAEYEAQYHAPESTAVVARVMQPAA